MARIFYVAKIFIVLLILAVAVSLVFKHNVEQKKVLVVHSYNKDLAWVNDIDDGIARALNAKGATELNVRTHYMNLKNHPDCHFYQNETADVRFTIDDWQPEVIILVDDLAQGLIGFNQLDFNGEENRAEQALKISAWLSGNRCENPGVAYFGLDKPADSPKPSIVFAGVNGTVNMYGYTFAKNVSGIYEHKNYKALIETLETLAEASNRQVDHVQMLNDNSPTAISENINYTLVDWSPFDALPPLAVATLKQWKAAVVEANATNTLLLIANYQNVIDENGLPVSPEILITWTEKHSLLPVLGANTDFVADGGMMTVAISGTEQGEIAMQLALDKLTGSEETSRVEAKQFLIGMNQSLVRKRNLVLPGIYEAFSREVGQFVEVVEHLYMEQQSNE